MGGPPNYRLRLSVLVAILYLIAGAIVVITPAPTLQAWGYWIGFAGFAVLAWVTFWREPLPGRKPRAVRSSRRRLGWTIVLLAVLSAVIVGLRRALGFISQFSWFLLIVYSFFPGLLVGTGSFQAWTFLLRGKGDLCNNCRDYYWFRRIRGKWYCVNCGAEFSEKLSALVAGVGPLFTSTPMQGPRIERSRLNTEALGTKVEKCSTCKATMHLSGVKHFSGSSGGVSVSFFNMPYLACPQGHSRRYLGGDFGGYLLEEILAGIPVVETRGAFRRQPVCSNCKNPMETMREDGSFGLRIKLYGLDSFLVDVSMPVTRCRICQHQYAFMDQQMASNLADAIIAAFDTIDLKR